LREWDSLLLMKGLRYCVVLGDKKRIASLLKAGHAVELTQKH